MNKVLKGFLIAACVCILLGIAVLVGVMASGGSAVVRDVMQNGGVYWDNNGFHVGPDVIIDYNDEDWAESITNGKEHTVPVDGIEEVDIELKAGVFKIVEGDTDEIIVRSSNEVAVFADNDSISIETEDKNIIFGVGNDGQNVEITLPKGHEFHTMEIEVAAGELDVDSLSAEEITLEAGAGIIEVDNLLCEKAVISVGAGEAIVKNGVAKDVGLDVGMGDFQFDGSIIGDLDADCGMGNMDITLAGTENDYDYQIDCGMGDVSIGNTSFGGMASSKEIDNDADAEFDLDCGMGSINIKFKD